MGAHYDTHLGRGEGASRGERGVGDTQRLPASRDPRRPRPPSTPPSLPEGLWRCLWPAVSHGGVNGWTWRAADAGRARQIAPAAPPKRTCSVLHWLSFAMTACGPYCMYLTVLRTGQARGPRGRAPGPDTLPPPEPKERRPWTPVDGASGESDLSAEGHRVACKRDGGATRRPCEEECCAAPPPSPLNSLLHARAAAAAGRRPSPTVDLEGGWKGSGRGGWGLRRPGFPPRKLFSWEEGGPLWSRGPIASHHRPPLCSEPHGEQSGRETSHETSDTSSGGGGPDVAVSCGALYCVLYGLITRGAGLCSRLWCVVAVNSPDLSGESIGGGTSWRGRRQSRLGRAPQQSRLVQKRRSRMRGWHVQRPGSPLP